MKLSTHDLTKNKQGELNAEWHGEFERESWAVSLRER
jgi:hypothetical protein